MNTIANNLLSECADKINELRRERDEARDNLAVRDGQLQESRRQVKEARAMLAECVNELAVIHSNAAASPQWIRRHTSELLAKIKEGK